MEYHFTLLPDREDDYYVYLALVKANGKLITRISVSKISWRAYSADDKMALKKSILIFISKNKNK